MRRIFDEGEVGGQLAQMIFVLAFIACLVYPVVMLIVMLLGGVFR